MLATNPQLADSVVELANAHLVDNSRPVSDVLGELQPAYRLIAECAFVDICSGGGNADYLRGLTAFSSARVFSDPDFPSEANERGYGVGWVVETPSATGSLRTIERADSMDGAAVPQGRCERHLEISLEHRVGEVSRTSSPASTTELAKVSPAA